MESSALGWILKPVPETTFLAEYYTQNVLHVRSNPNKFEQLFSWPALNQILRTQDLRFPRMRLQKENKVVERLDYFNEEPGMALPLTLSVSKLNSQFLQGATLIINAVELSHEPVAFLTDDLSRIFKARVAANLYASWRKFPASGIHRDDHGVIIVQIAGRKFWRVYRDRDGFTVNPKDRTQANDVPVWSGVLEKGDLLYIPKQWPHVAIPCDEPTLHLTISIFEYSAMDVLHWLIATRFGDSEYLSSQLPPAHDSNGQAAYIAAFAERVRELFDEPQLIEKFLADFGWMAQDRILRFGGRSAGRPLFGLPWSATTRAFPENEHDKYLIRSGSPVGLDFVVKADIIEVEFDDHSFTFEMWALPILQSLQNDRPALISEWFQKFVDIQRDQLEQLLRRLVNTGIAVIRSKPQFDGRIELVANG